MPLTAVHMHRTRITRVSGRLTFGTILADPPWSYQKTTGHKKLSGYSDRKYRSLSTAELCDLPVADIVASDSVLVLWTTWPFVPDAVKVCEAWGFKYVTGLPWVKTNPNGKTVNYGIGYWFRGVSEPILVGKRGRAYRTNFAGLISPAVGHSRKPAHVYELAERFPAPRLELFARTPPDQLRPAGWYQLGDECGGDGEDMRILLPKLVAGPAEAWERYRVRESLIGPPSAPLVPTSSSHFLSLPDPRRTAVFTVMKVKRSTR